MSTVSPSMSAITLEKIQDKTALVGVVGLGYVGLPLIHAFIRGGLKCIGYDIDQKKIDSLQEGQSYIEHIPSDWIQQWQSE